MATVNVSVVGALPVPVSDHFGPFRRDNFVRSIANSPLHFGQLPHTISPTVKTQTASPRSVLGLSSVYCSSALLENCHKLFACQEALREGG